MIEIPLTSEPSQTLSMNIDSVVYDFRVIYNTRAQTWSIGITIDSEAIVSGIAIVCGVDLVKQHPGVLLNNLYAFNVVDSNLDATSSNLGSDVKLILLTDDEVSSVTSV